MSKEPMVNSLQRGLTLLEGFTRERPRLKLQELTLAANLPKTTVLRLLRTLVSLNYVRFDALKREYSLGPKVMSLGYATLVGLDLKEIARPYLKELSQATGQNVNLGILDGTEVVYIERITRKQLITTDHTVGSRVNLYSTAIGRAILAYLDPEEREKVVRVLFTHPGAKEIGMRRERFLELLLEVRRNGYAVNNEEFIAGIRGIGAPIFNSEGKVDAAVNMPVFSKSVSLRQLTRQYAPMLLRTASDISGSRGFMGPPPEQTEFPTARKRG
jgi:IclR family transcriptional regulator, pca regulon regulatory protein